MNVSKLINYSMDMCWNGQGTTMGNERFQNLEKIRSHFDTLLKSFGTVFSWFSTVCLDSFQQAFIELKLNLVSDARIQRNFSHIFSLWASNILFWH